MSVLKIRENAEAPWQSVAVIQGEAGQDGANGLTTSITFNGTTYTQEDGNIDLGDVSGGVFDLVIRTQAEFEEMYNSDTWLDAVSVCFVGDGGTLGFTRSDGLGLKIPQTVKNLKGLNNATINIENFVWTSTNESGLWYETKPEASADCWIDGLMVVCAYGMEVGGATCFYNCINLTNCYAHCFSDGEGYCFINCTSLSNCHGVGFGDASSFYNCDQLLNCSGRSNGANEVFLECNQLLNCTSFGESDSACSAFADCHQLSNCIGVGVGGGNGVGYGFNCCSQLSNCIGTGTNTTSGGYGFYNCSYLNGCKQGSTPSSTANTGGTMTFVDSDTVYVGSIVLPPIM